MKKQTSINPPVTAESMERQFRAVMNVIKTDRKYKILSDSFELAKKIKYVEPETTILYNCVEKLFYAEYNGCLFDVRGNVTINYFDQEKHFYKLSEAVEEFPEIKEFINTYKAREKVSKREVKN